MPAIIQFLGYDPQPPADPLSERLAATRKRLGLSQRKMAAKLGVDPCTVKGWEAGLHRPSDKGLDLIGNLFKSLKCRDSGGYSSDKNENPRRRA